MLKPQNQFENLGLSDYSDQVEFFGQHETDLAGLSPVTPDQVSKFRQGLSLLSKIGVEFEEMGGGLRRVSAGEDGEEFRYNPERFEVHHRHMTPNSRFEGLMPLGLTAAHYIRLEPIQARLLISEGVTGLKGQDEPLEVVRMVAAEETVDIMLSAMAGVFRHSRFMNG